MKNFERIRADFPILSQTVYGKPLVYLDNGATTQKPQVVIETLKKYYEEYNSNVHRGVHFLSQKATDHEEEARETVRAFINASETKEIIFTKGTTDAINLLAYSFGKKHLKPGDEIIVTEMEHHSNIIPWQIACEDRGAVLKYIPFTEDGVLDLNYLKKLITPNTKLIAFTWVSNTLGTINPVEEIISIAHSNNIPVFVDAAQSVQHLPTDVQALDIDYLAFSGHKIYGPTGIGVLYGKADLLSELPPYQSGGSMISNVSFKGSTYADLPFKFEAGTPNIAGIIGLGAAIKYVLNIGLKTIAQREHQLLEYLQSALEKIDPIRIIGTAPDKSATVSFLVGDKHPYDVGELLDKQGIAVRTGHHCCQPIMDRFQIPGTVRASLSFYNNEADIDAFIKALKKGIMMLS
ncbi:MAG TPA: cysteine desulfurase [Edaphocola sp.]|nr:cysteine desulfurase [Edaphocola sp.]